ncbi:ABC transporter like ATPase [Dunaliella salina]|uniref:ABC transporter like ATPase n=1 Tax=Dunaliella salina TaxID=3046 RepID=A0ABQ7GQJ3_DUNSA|nr:ABC transporter like ATPase [Dunaliella salina]|eukprot:KAF5836880.1 ABC transporter like ATPase [Dunaliella salina]
MAILDEIDSGLDIDALRDVAKAVNALKRPDSSVLMVTHYKRLLEYVQPEFVHIMEGGKIARTGDVSLADQLEVSGYSLLQPAA